MKQTSLVRVAIVLGIFLSAPLVHSQTSSAFFKDTFEQLLRNDPEFATGAGRHELPMTIGPTGRKPGAIAGASS